MASTRRYDLTPGWRGVLADLGVSHRDVLRRAGLPEDMIDRGQTRVTAEEFFAVTRAMGEMIDDPAFPVRIAEAITPEYFSPSLFAVLCSSNLAVAARRFARFKPLLAPVELEVVHDATGLHVGYHWAHVPVHPPGFISGAEAVVLTRIARIGTRQHLCPSRVIVPALPAGHGAYEAFLGARLELGETFRVSFSPADAEVSFLTENHGMWSIFEPSLRKRLADLRGSESFEERTRAVLLEALPSGQASVQQVSRRLAVSTRTLQRRLHDEGTNFNAVVRNTRERLARHYLSRTQLTVSEIAFLVGFEDPSSFFRAFQSWTGLTPETARRAMQPS